MRDVAARRVTMHAAFESLGNERRDQALELAGDIGRDSDRPCRGLHMNEAMLAAIVVAAIMVSAAGEMLMMTIIAVSIMMTG